MKRPILPNRVALFALTLTLASGSTLAQEDYGSRLGVRKADAFSYEPQGAGVLLHALDPAMRKWYVPQELYLAYRWRQWEYTNYAREPFQRYVSVGLEGDYFYDLYGRFVTKGWLIYDQTQTQPQTQFGSSIYKDPRFAGWFNGLLIASDGKGQYHYSLGIGSQLRTVLTPLTFAKSRFNGLQWDLASDKYEATVLYSRISAGGGDPPVRNTNNTTLFGSRISAQVGDFITLGANLVNAHHSHTQLSGFKGSAIKGELTVDQNSVPVSWVEVILRDDSPEDGVGGAAFFEGGSDLIITYIDGFEETANEIGFEPIIDGGFPRAGFRAADGSESITVRYDFDATGFVAGAHGDKSEIAKVRFRLAVGNDYQIWMNSSRQTTAGTAQLGSRGEQPTPLLVARAAGNVQDNSNLRLLSFEYGLPTASHIVGTTVEMRNVAGFNLYGEFDRSFSYRMYPNPNLITHDAASGIVGNPASDAWMVNVSKQAHPYFLFGEAFSMEHGYSTTAFVTETRPRPGFVDYQDTRNFFEFVDDNDDQDRFPDNQRRDYQTGDFEVFPGWDENNDFISDFNQNDNRRSQRPNEFPDYEEPFLRFNVDRPEFLFGPDMNNNGWIDRFENDEEPDYPYRRDHRGHNIYAGADITPELRVTAGRIDERLLSEARYNETNYLLATLDRDYPGFGRLRVFDMLKRTKDDIHENLFQWVYASNESQGELRRISDPLLFEDAWHNSLWLGHDYTGLHNLKVINKVKFDVAHTFLDSTERRVRSLVQNEHFFGLVNKVGYRLKVGFLELEPRWKSEYRHQSRDLFSATKREELTEMVSVLGRFPFLRRSFVEAGVEYLWFKDLRENRNDLSNRILAVQFTNRVDYLGYKLTTQLGMKLDRRDPKGEEAITTQENFIIVYAGLE